MQIPTNLPLNTAVTRGFSFLNPQAFILNLGWWLWRTVHLSGLPKLGRGLGAVIGPGAGLVIWAQHRQVRL